MRLINRLCLLSLALGFSFVVLTTQLKVRAAAQTAMPAAKISFTFDDGLTSAATIAAPTLAKYGFTGTDYVISNCVGMTTKPNTCRANTDTTYMTWAQIQSLQDTSGWEIGSHTLDHQCLASNASVDPDDCQANTLTTAQVDAELANSKAALAANGLNATDMSTPYGDYNPAVIKEISKYYTSQRGFADTGYNAAPYNQYILRDQYADGPVSLATMENYVNQAIASNQWLVFTFHDIKAKASKQQYDYEWSTSNLDQLAAYIKSKAVPVVNVHDGLIGGTNLLSNPSFDSGMTGWSTDKPSNVILNSANNGSYPSSTNSVAITAGAQNAHLFSPKVSVTPGSTYMIQSFMNLTRLTSGSLSYYIDEYNANGTWISGQYKQGVSFPWPQTAGFSYTPSSASVVSASLQIAAPANSGIMAYVDNFQWINESITPIPPPVQTNLVTNGTFDAGISSGWTTDGPANIVADSTNNGSPANPINSVKMTATTTNKHLFSPKVAITTGKTYNLSTYINVIQLTGGEVGFYMDEYDASGNWISGKYVTGARAIGSTTVSFDYTPSSTNVRSASLQIILVSNSGILAFVDNVVWLQN